MRANPKVLAIVCCGTACAASLGQPTCDPDLTLLDFHATSNQPVRAIAVVGDTAFIGATDTFRAIDITDPSDLVQLDSIDTQDGGAGVVHDVVVRNDYAFATESFRDLLVFDVSDPGDLSEVANAGLGVGESSLRIALAGTVACISTNSSHVRFVDISNPEDPVVDSAVYEPDGNGVLGMVVSGDYLFATTTEGLESVSLSPLSGTLNSEEIVGDGMGEGILQGARDVTLQGDYAYVVSANGVGVVDVSNPLAMELVGELSLPEGATDVAVAGGLLFVADTSGQDFDIYVIDVADPESPALLDEYAVSGVPEDIALAGSVLLVGNQNSSVQSQNGLRTYSYSGCCLSDVTDDGVVNIDDVNTFASAFTANASEADLDNNGLWNIDDINLFSGHFTAGCY